MRKVLPLVALACFASTFACAPKKQATKVRPGIAQLERAATPHEMKKILQEWTVTCDSSTDCPDYVAQMVAVSPDGSTATLCTATLVGPDLILTNSHCLEDAALTPAQLCQTTKFIFADKSPSGSETAICKEVVAKSDIVANVYDRPDYMVLRLTKALSRKPIAISRSGLLQRESLAIHAIDPDVKNGGGVLKTDHCTILQGTAYLPDATHDTDPVMVTRDCEIVDGNSGSPLVDDKGTVAAIAFASVVNDSVTQTMNTLNGNIFDQIVEAAKMAHVTNLACVEIPGAPSSPAICKTQKALHRVTRVSPNLDPVANWPAIFAAVKAASRAHKDLTERKLGYRATLDKDNGSVHYKAFCFNDAPTWLPQYGVKPVASAKVKAVEMNWKLDWTLSDDLKAVPKLTDLGSPTTPEFEFSPAKLAATGLSPMTDLASGATSFWKACPARK